MFYSLRIRLFLTFLTVVVLAVAVVTLLANRGTLNGFNWYLARNFQREQQTIATLLEEEISREGIEGSQPLVQSLGLAYGRRITITNSQGEIIASSGPLSPEFAVMDVVQVAPSISSTLLYQGVPFAFIIEPQQGVEQALEMATPTRLQSFPFSGATMQFMPAEVAERRELANNEQTFLGSVNRSFFLAAFLAVAVTGLLSIGLSQRILKPVQAVTVAAQRLERGDLSQRVVVQSRDEIGQLAHAFNAMADSLETQERLRRNMVTDIAHELRTPLSNIRGYLEALQDGVLPPNTVTIDSLYEETMLLNRLIEDLQELSLAEAGQLRLQRQPVVVEEVVALAITSTQPQAIQHQVSVTAHLSPVLPPVHADARRVGQILRNLLSNGIGYTPPGGCVEVSAESNGGEVYIRVSDTGPGIEPAHLARIFDRFYRADPSRNRSTGGSGLGLAIVKALVDMHNGRIWVDSQVGKGTTFTFTLPTC